MPYLGNVPSSFNVGTDNINNDAITTAKIADGAILNADVNAAAAIAGTKISPDFGSQNILTTGTTTAASLIPTSSTAPTNGLYLPAANSVAISTNGTGRLFVDSSGRISLGAASTTHDFDILKTSSGATTSARIGSTAATGVNNATFILNSGGTGNSTLRFDYESATNYASISSASSSQTLIFGTGGSERMRLDSSGRLGLGTSSPGYKLDVTGPGTSNGVTLNLSDSASVADSRHIQLTRSSSTAFIGIAGSAVNDPFFISRSGTNSDFIVTSAGRVGINTTAPSQPLEVVTASGGGIALRPSTGNATQGLLFYDTASGPWGFVKYDHQLSALSFGTVNSERARIDASGRLLVGTSSAFDTANTGTSWLVGIEKPSGYSALSIKTNEASPNGAYLNLGKSRGTTANSKALVNNNDELGGIYFEGADGASMLVAARVAAFVDGTPGASDLPTRLVFSTTADGASSPTERFRIANTGRGSYFSSSSSGFQFSSSPGASVTDNIIEGLYGATGVTTGTLSFLVRTNGNVLNTNSSYGALSDLKLKENIVDAASQWDDIKALRVRKYNFKEGQTHTQIGVIAQEVEQVSPGLVTESPDRDAEGNDLGTTTKAVQYSVLYMKAVKALQEAMERIETLEAKVAALESA